MRKTRLFNHSIAIIFILVSISCLLITIISMLNLPQISSSHSTIQPHNPPKLGKFGEIMIQMLPQDLAFTVFVPSEIAFERHFRFAANHSFSSEEWDNTYATVSRVLGFSAVPRKIFSESISIGEEQSFDSVSGFRLCVSKDLRGGLIVNRVRSNWVDGKRGKLVVHIMDGAIMDSQFEQSVMADGDEHN